MVVTAHAVIPAFRGTGRSLDLGRLCCEALILLFTLGVSSCLLQFGSLCVCYLLWQNTGSVNIPIDHFKVHFSDEVPFQVETVPFSTSYAFPSQP